MASFTWLGKKRGKVFFGIADYTYVERRSEPRFPANRPVRLTILGKDPRTIDATLVDVSGRGMRIAVDEAIPSGSAIKIETEDSLWLVEVTFSLSVGNGYLIGGKVDQVLRGLADLAQLRRAVLGEQPESRTPSTVEQPVDLTPL